VHLGILRLFHVESELLISLNTPQSVHERSSAVRPDLAFVRADEASVLFTSVIESVIIKDWTLFG